MNNTTLYCVLAGVSKSSTSKAHACGTSKVVKVRDHEIDCIRRYLGSLYPNVDNHAEVTHLCEKGKKAGITWSSRYPGQQPRVANRFASHEQVIEALRAEVRAGVIEELRVAERPAVIDELLVAERPAVIEELRVAERPAVIEELRCVEVNRLEQLRETQEASVIQDLRDSLMASTYDQLRIECEPLVKFDLREELRKLRISEIIKELPEEKLKEVRLQYLKDCKWEDLFQHVVVRAGEHFRKAYSSCLTENKKKFNSSSCD